MKSRAFQNEVVGVLSIITNTIFLIHYVFCFIIVIGCCVFERKCIARHKGSMCIGVEGNVITIEMQCSSRREVLTFELDKPYEIRAGKPSKVCKTFIMYTCTVLFYVVPMSLRFLSHTYD